MNALEEHIKPRLDDAFGKGMTMLIMMSSSKIAQVSLLKLNSHGCLKLARAICKDQRVINMWGEAGAREQLNEWEKLLTE